MDMDWSHTIVLPRRLDSTMHISFGPILKIVVDGTRRHGDPNRNVEKSLGMIHV